MARTRGHSEDKWTWRGQEDTAWTSGHGEDKRYLPPGGPAEVSTDITIADT